MTIQVFLLNGFQQIGEITAFDLVQIVEKDLDVGSFQVVFDPVRTPAAALAATTDGDNPWLGIEAHDTETGWRYKGKVTQRRRLFQGERFPRRIELRGVDLMDELAAALEWPDSGDSTNWWVTATSSFQLSTTVTNDMYFQRGPGALPERQIDGLNIITPSPPFGPTKDSIATGRPLLETWQPWFKNTDWTMRMRFNRVGVAGDGEVLFEPAERAVTPVVITPELHPGQIEIIETAAAATDVIGMGGLTGSVADPEERFTARQQGTEDNWLRGRRERFINRPLAGLQEIIDETADDARANGPRLTAIVEDIDIPDYGTSILIGDYVTVAFSPDEGAFLSPISEARLVGDPDGWTRTASTGDPGLSGPNLFDSRLDWLANQVRRVEGDLR